jgi:hypothetical protein
MIADNLYFNRDLHEKSNLIKDVKSAEGDRTLLASCLLRIKRSRQP